MIPLGLGQAATVRVAFELGAGRRAAAGRAAYTALCLGTVLMVGTGLLLWGAPSTIIGIYLDAADPANRGLIVIAGQLIIVAALFQVFDGVQAIAAGGLRGYRDTTVPMLFAAFGYWGVGFAGGWLLAFPLGFGPVGLWWGLALGLGVVSVLLTARLHRRASMLQPAPKPAPAVSA
jgi:MATE family multidrug resistance protein